MIALLMACDGGTSTELPHPPPGQPMNMPEAFHATPDFQLEGATGEHRKLLIVSLDTVRADSLSPWGGRVEGLSGVLPGGEKAYKRAYSHFPQTCLSHWTMMTGVMPTLHGNTPRNRGSLWTGPTLAEIAKREGYATAAFIGGQTLMDSQCGLSRGFDVYDDDFVIDPRDMRRHGRDVIGSATRWIDQQKGDWFAFVHLFDAHFPYTPEKDRFDAGYTGGINGDDAVLRPFRDGQRSPSPRDVEHIRALYDSEIAELAEWLKPLWTAVDEDTLVVVTSDHGESFEHDYWFNHKDSLMEGVLHVPLTISGPGIEPGVVDEPIGLVDLAPTLLGLAGLPLDARMQGQVGAGREVLIGVTDPWDPMGTQQYSEREGSQLRLESPEGTRCWSWPEEVEQACVGMGHRSAYREELAALKGWQVDPPDGVHPMTPEECERLEALGYVDCGR